MQRGVTDSEVGRGLLRAEPRIELRGARRRAASQPGFESLGKMVEDVIGQAFYGIDIDL
jgi:hypothetical protein